MKIHGAVVGDERVLIKIRKYPQGFQKRLKAKMEWLAIKLQAKVINKLSGKVLNARTGTLRRSTNYKIFDRTHSVTASVGVNTPYAAYHEYGFTGTQSVKGFLRVIKGKPQSVRPHQRHVNYPARSYLRSSLKDMKRQIVTELRGVVKE